MKAKILIIDDETNIRDVFSLLLEEKGYGVASAETGREGIAKALETAPDLVLLDMHLPDLPGLDVLARLKEALPETKVIIITAFGTVRSAVDATRLGAYDYLEKPIDNDELLLVVARTLEVNRLSRMVESLKSELSSRYHFSNIVGTGTKMNSVFQMMGKIAQVDGTVLITGESGTGKELVARAIHFHSRRKNEPFVVVNCGAIPKDLIESEFFGHTKGAFTDAKFEKTGKFELAHQGTIFLDEVGELLPEAQVKLLRALGEKEIIKVGGVKTIPVDVRVIAATNKNLEEAVRAGAFREDLYWRLAVLSVHLPPLRERVDDLPLLCDHFIQKYNRELGKDVRGLEAAAVKRLSAYAWPGNVRELESVIYEGVVMSESPTIEEQNLPLRIRGRNIEKEEEAADGASLSSAVRRVLEKTERNLILKTLEETRGNRTKAAKILGVSRKTLFNKMTHLRIIYPG